MILFHHNFEENDAILVMAAAIQPLLKTAVWVLPYDACEAEMKILKRCVNDS
jgi:hypothetical protein